MQKQNLKAYLALAFLAVLAGALFVSVCKAPKPAPALCLPAAGTEGEANKSPYQPSNATLSDDDSRRYAIYCRRITEQHMANANEGESRYPDCVYPPMSPDVWAAKGKPMPAEPVVLTEEQQEKREAEKWDRIFAQQAKYNGPVGNTP